MYPAAVLGVLAVVVVVSAVSGAGTEGAGEHLGGDYPAFYGAGRLAREGAWDDLYDEAAQQEAQEGLVDDEGGYLYFAYPPPVAALYGPLSALDYRWSYLIHTALMAAALAGAVLLARGYVPAVDRYPVAAYAVVLAAYPLFRAVIGGQNTALTLLLLVAATRFEGEGRFVASGLAAGLMLYKPQFGIVVIGLLVLRRRWRAVGAAALVGVAWWGWSAALLGAGWASEWWDQALAFSSLDARVNSVNLVSLRGVLHHFWGDGGAAAGWVLAAALLAGLAVWWWRNRSAAAFVLFPVAAAAAVLALPRTLFYEAGLALVAAVVAAGPKRMRWVAAWVAATWLQPLLGDVGSAALMLVVAAALALLVFRPGSWGPVTLGSPVETA